MTTTQTISRERLESIKRASGLEPCDWEEVFESITAGEVMALVDIALAALDSEPVAVPDGYVLVPLKPTKDMLTAAEDERGADWQYAVDIWYSMCRAAMQAEPVTGWIKCSEQTPPVNRSVWIYSPTRGVKAKFALAENGKFFYDLQRDDDDIDDATHWMPENAPAAPEQELKNEN